MNMELDVTEQRSLHLNEESLMSFVRTTIGGLAGRPDDENPLPHGPWDPHIRIAARLALLAGPSPEPWRHYGRFAGVFGEEAALNPQPLPPRYAFLSSVAQVVIERAGLLEEMTSATADRGSQRSIIIVGGYTARFVDDWRGNGFSLRWPLPGPTPPWWPRELGAFDLMVMATQFEGAAREAFTPELRGHFNRAAVGFANAGVARLEGRGF